MSERKIPPGQKECPTCGGWLKKNETHPTVVRVVRARNKYGTAGPGQMVEIEPQQINTAIELATMSLEEHEMIVQAKQEPKKPEKGQLTQMVENALASTKAQVDNLINVGKRDLERARERAIARGEDIPRDPPPRDQQPPSREYKAVEEE